MRMKILDWDNHILNDTSYKATVFIGAGNGLVTAEPSYIDMGQGDAVLGGKVLSGSTFTIQVQLLGSDDETREAQRDTLTSWFLVNDFSFRRLRAYNYDVGISDVWYLEGFPITPPMLMDDAIDTYSITIAMTTPYWIKETAGEVTWNITSTTETEVVDNLGNVPSLPVFEITPNDAKSGIPLNVTRFYVGVYFVNETDSTKVWGPITFVDLTPAGIDTTALVGAGKMRADGNDVRVFVNGSEVSRYFGGDGMNTANTHIWAYVPLYGAPTFYSNTAMDDTTTPSTIAVHCYRVRQFSRTITQSQKGTLRVGDELIGYTSVTIAALGTDEYLITFGGLTRGVYDSVKAVHVVDDPVYWVPVDVWVVYGNPSASAPVIDASTYPPFNIELSSNDEWVFDGHFSPDNYYNAPWTQSPYTNGNAIQYTATQNVGSQVSNNTQPWEVLGAKLSSKLVNNLPTSDTFEFLRWIMGMGHGIGEVIFSGQRYRSGAAAGLATLYYGANQVLYTVPEPVAADSWEVFSGSFTVPEGPNNTFVSFEMRGGLGSTLPLATAQCELSAVTLVAASPPVVFIPIIESETGNYSLGGYLENSENGHRIVFRDVIMKIGDTLTIDCAELEAYLSTGVKARGFIDFEGPARDEWMTFVKGENSLVFYDLNTADLTIVISQPYRNTA